MITVKDVFEEEAAAQAKKEEREYEDAIRYLAGAIKHCIAEIEKAAKKLNELEEWEELLFEVENSVDAKEIMAKAADFYKYINGASSPIFMGTPRGNSDFVGTYCYNGGTITGINTTN